ncbi:DUF7281 domain-containing protein [Psychromonas sp. PT13]|uniref:DUF7281 domain-containing protein n=1 Tax=Psychromonas sp. PT13 TaxID=3439547 RepID=UPI003EBD2C89
MKKALYQFCQSKFKTLSSGRLKLSALLLRLHHEYTFGEIKGDYLYFNEHDRMALIERVRFENGVHLLREPFPELQSRSKIAQHQRNEKVGSYAVSQDFILVNCLKNLRVNHQQTPISPITSLGLYLKADDIISVEHPQIVFVENLEMMANLAQLDIPDNLQSALWVYRGDIKKQQSTTTSYHFFRRFKDTNQLICFSDLDPKGIEIAITSGAHYWLTAEDTSLVDIELHGDEYEWFKQTKTIKYLQVKTDLPEKCQVAFIDMCLNRKTLKQEHMLEHRIKLGLFEL